MVTHSRQQLLPFPDVPADASPPTLPTADQPTDKAVAAFARLEGWLVGPRGAVTALAEETLRAVAMTLLEGKNGYFHAAEDGLEVLKLRNGKTDGDDIPVGIGGTDGDDFQGAVEVVLDCMYERMFHPRR